MTRSTDINTPSKHNIRIAPHQKTTFLGHRGARGEVFENSRAGFVHLQQLAQQHPHSLVGVEFDVQLTEDGQLVVFHDENLWRLYHQQSLISQMSYAELSRKIASNTRHSTLLRLQDMSPFLQGYHHIELEVKTHTRTDYAMMIQALQQALNLPHIKNLPITITSFDTRLLDYLNRTKTIMTVARTGLLVAPKLRRKASVANALSNARPAEEGLYNMPHLARRLGCSHIGFYFPLIDKTVMQHCQRLQLSTSAWTVNDAEEITRLTALKVNYIITDYPSTLVP